MTVTKKKTPSLNKKSFYSQYQTSSREELQETEDMQKQKKYDEFVRSLGKKMRMLDIELMDDAPLEWNRFPRLKRDNPSKYVELLMSIDINGTYSPLIVWTKTDGRYMILAGHNRRDANLDILAAHEGEPGFDIEKHKKLPCMVYDVDEIDDVKAREIIIDTNYLQREDNAKQTAWIIKSRMDMLLKQKNSKGQSIEQLSKSLGIRKSAIYDTLSIVNKVIPAFQDMYYDEVITKKAVLKLTYFNELMQEWMLKEFGDKITSKRLMKLKKSMTMKESIREIFEEELKKTKTVTIDIPEDRYNEFQELIKNFLEQ